MIVEVMNGLGINPEFVTAVIKTSETTTAIRLHSFDFVMDVNAPYEDIMQALNGMSE